MCKVEGCTSNKNKARGLCSAHYQKIKRDQKNQGCFKYLERTGRYATDLTSMKFGRLLVIKRGPDIIRGLNKVTWDCICDCGKTFNVRATALKAKGSSKVRSCGCLKRLPRGE